MKKHRLLELDALRGLAAVAVVLYHYFYRYDVLYGHQNIPVGWSYNGKLGVQLFFIVSGFVIFWTLVRIQKPLDFIVSRFSRLYPAYWVALGLTFLIVLVFGLPGREVSFSNAIVNILMFHEYLKIPHVDGVYWTLTVELTFYFWVFFLYLSGNLRKIEWIFIFLVVISVLHSVGFISIPAPIYKIFILKYLPFFMAGISFYKIVDGEKPILSFIALTISLISTIFIYSLNEFFIFSLFYCIFYLAVSGYLKILAVKPLVFLGTISYSLYLLHQNIGYVIINKFYEAQLNPLAGIVCAFIIVMFLASISSKYIEKPSLVFIRNKYKESKKMQKIAKKLSPFS